MSGPYIVVVDVESGDLVSCFTYVVELRTDTSALPPRGSSPPPAPLQRVSYLRNSRRYVASLVMLHRRSSRRVPVDSRPTDGAENALGALGFVGRTSGTLRQQPLVMKCRSWKNSATISIRFFSTKAEARAWALSGAGPQNKTAYVMQYHPTDVQRTSLGGQLAACVVGRGSVRSQYACCGESGGSPPALPWTGSLGTAESVVFCAHNGR